MKYLIVFLFFSLGLSLHAQTNLRTVMVDTNGVIQRPTNLITTNGIVSVDTNGVVANPTNFWTANSNSINSIVSNVVSVDWVLQNFASIDWIIPSLSEKEQSNSDIFTIGSVAQLQIPATNSSGVAAIRMSRNPNFSHFTGSGIRWGITNSFFVRIATTIGTNGDIARIILGGPRATVTNFAGSLTNYGVGMEITNNNGTNQIRLIAHNGSTNIESPWINAASLTTERINIGVISSAGIINLYQSKDSFPLALVTNISITNGPTQNSGNDSAAFSAGLIATNTNSANRAFVIYDAILRAIE